MTGSNQSELNSLSERWRSVGGRYPRALAAILILVATGMGYAQSPDFSLKLEPLTTGPKHHLFGYIGQCQTVPWNQDERYILCMEIDAIDRMPEPGDAATICLIDTQQDNRLVRLDRTHAWNPQQGTMFYWNPLAAETQFFFNDRDIDSGKVFTVLYDVAKKRRVREYRYDDTPLGNAGVAADGSAWLGLNYGRLARLRLVTGYPDALDWSRGQLAPDNDGLFMVGITSGEKRLLASYQQIDSLLKKSKPGLVHTGLFINHALWNRDCDRIYFFARAGWSGNGGDKVNVPFSIHSDGSGLTLHKTHVGGHPEWAEGSLLIGRQDGKQILYDVDQQAVVEQWGDRSVFPNPEGDISLSPNGRLFVNGYKKGDANFYVVYRRSDGTHCRSQGVYKGPYGGDIRIDPAPRWNRSNNAILVPGIGKDKTRQLFLFRLTRNDDL